MSSDAVSRLERAAALLDRGLLTAAEFAVVKSNILDDISKLPPAPLPSGGLRRWPAPAAAHPAGGSRAPASISSHEWWILHDVLSMHVMQWIDVGTALRCRAVCSRWRRVVAATNGLQPMEAGLPAAEMDAGLQEQRAVRVTLQKERDLWADDVHSRRFTKLAYDL